jgi:hypothetical protein
MGACHTARPQWASIERNGGGARFVRFKLFEPDPTGVNRFSLDVHETRPTSDSRAAGPYDPFANSGS